MQDLKNGIDDLFRKAVERYPLKTCDSRWDELSTRINSQKRWVLFLPILFRQKKMPISVFWGVLILIPVSIISVAPLVHKKATAMTKFRESTHLKISTIKSAGKSGWAFIPMKHKISYVANHENTLYQKRYSVDNKIPPNDEGSGIPPSTIDFTESICKYTQAGILHSNGQVLTEINLVHSGSPLQFEGGPNRQASAQTFLSPTLQHINAPRRQGFYLGLVGGPSFSQVKNQVTTKPGFDVGMFVGYTISRKFSLETGLMHTRQNFVVTGDYLLRILNMSGVRSLDGSRDALTIPLKLKYNVITGSSGNFFLTTGFSSFVGVSDHIAIRVNYSPVPSPGKIDLGPPSFLPAYLNFSVGYEYKIGKFSNFRIEPYLEIPTNNSAGNSFKTRLQDHYVQVFNTGIHIAISKFFHSSVK